MNTLITSSVCSACGSPWVAGRDIAGEPVCGVCSALELGGRADRLEMAIDEVKAVAYRVVFDGDADPEVARTAFAEAAARAASDRQKAGLRAAPTLAEVEREIKELREFERLGL